MAVNPIQAPALPQAGREARRRPLRQPRWGHAAHARGGSSRASLLTGARPPPLAGCCKSRRAPVAGDHLQALPDPRTLEFGSRTQHEHLDTGLVLQKLGSVF